MPTEPAKPAKLMRPVCEVLMYAALSGKSWAKVIRLLPANTCAPNPMRNTELPDQANANRTSLIAPSTLLRSVTSTVSVIDPTTCRLTRLVSEERSRKVEELSPPAHCWPIGRTPTTSGKRAVVVLAVLEPAVTRLNSGEY